MSEVKTLSEAMLMPHLPSLPKPKGRVLGAGVSDFNDYTDPGYYLIDAQGSSPGNMPPGLTTGLAGVLIVIAVGGGILQVFLHGWSPSALFYRLRWYTTWRSWLRVTTAVAT